MDEKTFPYFYFVFGFINLAYIFETYLDYRQHLKYSVTKLPAKLAGLVKQEVFEKSQRYGYGMNTSVGCSK
jgi:hypothetical protein